MPYISVNHSLKIDFSAHSFSEPFTENSFYGSLCHLMSSCFDMEPRRKQKFSALGLSS